MEEEDSVQRIEERMEKLRQRLYHVAVEEGHGLQNPDVLLLSCELDALIVKYMELKKRDELGL